MDGVRKESTAMRIAWMLLLAVLVLVLDGCLGVGDGSQEGGREVITEETGSEKTSVQLTAEETSAADTAVGRGTTIAELPVMTLNLVPSRDSGVSGTVSITGAPGGVEVALDAQYLPTQSATEHGAHVHEGSTCADDRADNGAPVAYGLDPLYTNEDGTASSATSIVGVTFGQLFSDPAKYVNVHAEPIGEELPPGIACADLPLRGE